MKGMEPLFGSDVCQVMCGDWDDRKGKWAPWHVLELLYALIIIYPTIIML